MNFFTVEQILNDDQFLNFFNKQFVIDIKQKIINGLMNLQGLQFFYYIYNNNKSINCELNSEWFRFYKIDESEATDSCFRIFINCKAEYILRFLEFLMPNPNVSQIKVTTYPYTNQLPRDPDADDLTQQHPAIVVYLNKIDPETDQFNFDQLKLDLLNQFTNPELYQADNINIGKKRKNINGLFYWSDYSTTQTLKNKYLKYKFKYLTLKNL